MRRGGDALISAGVLTVLMIVLAAMDLRVRERFGGLLRGTAGSDVSSFGEQLQDIGGVVVTAAWNLSVANAPMTIFVIVAVILTVFMMRA